MLLLNGTLPERQSSMEKDLETAPAHLLPTLLGQYYGPIPIGPSIRLCQNLQAPSRMLRHPKATRIKGLGA